MTSGIGDKIRAGVWLPGERFQSCLSGDHPIVGSFHGKDATRMDIVWWHWMVVGLGLGLLELFVASFFVIWFGLGALLVGVAMLVIPTMVFSTQILLWTAASVAMTVAWFKVLRKDGGKTRSGQADEALGEKP